MNERLLILVGLLCFMPPTTLVAQETGSQPAAGRGEHSIVLDINGGPQIGFWARASDRTDLGLDLGVNGLLRGETTHLSVMATPAIKRYLTSTGPLAPYLYFGVPLNYTRQDNDNVGAPDDVQHGFGVGGRAAFGLEWFPVRQVSIGGHVGLQANFQHWNNDSDDTLQLGTVSSGARVHL